QVIVDDAFTASHPEAALIVPPLATAVGIYHTRPKLLYVPDQTGLAPYRGYIENEVALLERRPKAPKHGALPDHLGGNANTYGPVKYHSSTRVLEKLRAKPWKFRVDQENMLRARLLDMLLGDWDRHEDQWRWVRIAAEDGSRLYRPIPRDRDQVFADYDGLLLDFGRLIAPDLRVLGTFGDRIGDPTWLNYGARHIDSHFLNEIDRELWVQVAQEVEATVTDGLIDEALSKLQDEARELDGPKLAKKLRGRRDDLVSAATKFYESLSQKVVVTGSDRGDLVHARFDEDGHLDLQIRRRKLGASSAPYYARRFDPRDTDEVHLYTFSGKDELVVFGEPRGDIRLRFLGGRKTDLVRAVAPEGGRMRAKAVSVYDLPGGLTIDESIDVDDQRSENAYRNQYDRKDPHYEPTKVAFTPGFRVNPDDGVYLGGVLQSSHPGFKRRPYDIRHTIGAYFATTTLGVNGGYDAFLPNSLFGLDQQFGIDGTTPQFTRNFFGLTNSFIDPSDDSDRFRLRQSRLRLLYSLSDGLAGDLVRVGFDVDGTFVNTEQTEGRLVDDLVKSGAIEARALTDRYFVGGTAWARLDSRANSIYPKRGIFGEVFATARVDLTEDAGDRGLDTFGLFGGSLGGAIPFDPTGRFIVSTRARVQGIVGDYLFYWAPTLGASDIRSYNEEQLAGELVFSHTTDLRVEVIRITDGLPGVIGLAGAIDHGRAFGTNSEIDSSEEYHVSAGGTLFWNISGLLGIGASYHVGLQDPDERQRFMLLVGPLFASTGFRN
ncbi:MAG: hypothetical protein AAFU79_16800, partial [Myxococcota bacterium]